MFTLVGYGFLFGVYPSLVVQVFGINGLSTNWGFMTLAPVISGYIFNIFYGNLLPSPSHFSILILSPPFSVPLITITKNYPGKIFDSHSIILPDGTRQCFESIRCYSAAYWITFGASILAVFISLWSIRHDNATKVRDIKSERGRDIGRDAWLWAEAYRFCREFGGRGIGWFQVFGNNIFNQDGYEVFL